MNLATPMPLNLADALREVDEYWSPRIIGKVNDQYLKVAKLKGELAWHQHAQEDEMFMVIYGSLRIQMPDAEVELHAGDCHVVPRGTPHNPVAAEECGILLIETVSTLHTGDVVTPRTRSIADQHKR